MTPEEALRREFGTHYLADEMPAFTPDFVEGILPRWARASATRLGGDPDAMLRLLNMLRATPNDPLVETLSDSSGVDWHEEWATFVAILTYIAASIEAINRNDELRAGFRVFLNSEGDRTQYVLADEETGAEILTVQEPQLSGRRLRISFESKDPKLGAGRAAAYIETHLLREFLADSFRGLVDDVDYLELNGQTGLRLRYPGA